MYLPASRIWSPVALLLATMAGICAPPRHAAAQSDLHTAAITRVAVDPANRILATASEDKTVRIWQLSTGKLLRTIKPPSRTGDDGRIYALAISPDGRSIAFAGYTGQKNRRVVEDRTYFDYDVYVHDLASGKRLHTLTVPGIVDDLRWSPTGGFLLATTSEFPSLTIEGIGDLADAVHVFSASKYTAVADAPDIYFAAVAAYDQDGRLVIIGRPGGAFSAEILDTDFREVASRRFDVNPAAVSVSPDGSMFAVTTLFSELSVHSTTDLSVLYQRDFRADVANGPPVTSAEYSTVAWSADGRSLYFAGRATCSEHGCAIRKWDVGNWTSYKDINVSSHRVTHLASLSGGGVAFGTAGSGFGVVDSNDRRTLYREPLSSVQTRQRPEAGEKPQAAGEFWTQCEFAGPDTWRTYQLDSVRGKYLYIDKSGTAVLTPRFDSAGTFSEGLARVRLGDKYGYIDRSGRLAIPVQFEMAASFANGRAPVRSGGLIGYIDTTGRMVIPARYSDAAAFSGGLARVREYGSSYFGYINVLGEIVVPPKFVEAEDFRDGSARVRLNDTWGYIDTRSEWVTPPNKPALDGTGPAAGLTPVRTAEGKWGYADSRGTLIVPARYEAASELFESRGQVLRGGLWGYVDERGEEVIPPRFHRAFNFSEGVAAVCVSADRLATVSVSTTPAQPAIVSLPRASDPPIVRAGPFLLDDADQRRVDALHEKVESLLLERQYRAALAPAREALELVERRLPLDDPALIQPLWDLGRIHHALGNYRGFAGGGRALALATWRDARSVLERALALVERNKGAGHADVAALADELGDLLASLGEFDLALDMKQRMLFVARTNGGASSLPALKAANDLQILRVEKLVYPEYGKELSAALPMALAQARDAEEKLGADHLNVARGLADVAMIYGSSKVGVRSAAVDLYERALSLYLASGIDDRQQALKVRAAIAQLHLDAHQYVQAERHFEVLAEAMETALGADDPAVVQMWVERGYALRDSGRFEAAAGFFTRALAFWDARLQTEPTAIHDVRRALEPLADTWRFAGDYSRAEPLYRRLLESRDQHFVLNWSIVARVMRKLGTSQHLRGDAPAARNTFHEVIALLEPHRSSASGNGLSVADVITRQALLELSALATAANDVNAAADYLRRAGPLDERMFWFFPGGERELFDRSSNRSRSQFYDQALTIAARHLKNDREWVANAYGLVLDRKDITLDLQAQAKDAAGRPPERTRRNLEELATVRSELARLMVGRPESTNNANYPQMVTLLFERAIALEAEVSNVPTWSLGQPRRRVTAAEVATGLPRDTALIEFVRVRDEDPANLDVDAVGDENAIFVAFVLTPAGTPSIVEIGSAAAIEVLAGDLQSAMRSRANASLTSGLLKELHGLLWAPLEPLLSSFRQIVISPDGELHRVPFAALIGGDDRFLIERFQFAYVGSGRDLARPERVRATPTLDLALVADPDFGTGGKYAPLPGTAAEAEQIPPLVPGNRQKILRGGEATETAVKALPPSRILHMATHGFFLDRATFGLEEDGFDHALVKSGLALAGASRAGQPAGGDDGLLTALEVSGLDLSATDLVVLSSCDSGAGSVTHGQGVVGLRRAFSTAGARSVLMTLWPVGDDVTAQIMVGFYRNLSRLSPAAALHQAQVDALARIRARDGFAAPRLWAPFVLESANGFTPAAARQ